MFFGWPKDDGQILWARDERVCVVAGIVVLRDRSQTQLILLEQLKRRICDFLVEASEALDQGALHNIWITVEGCNMMVIRAQKRVP